eukprot:6200100-Pleurochrysis_carterae.AAC.1
MSCRSTLANCSGEITKWSLSSVVRARTVESDEADVGAAVLDAVPAGVERVVGPDAAAGAGTEGKENVGAMGEGESMMYGV